MPSPTRRARLGRPHVVWLLLLLSSACQREPAQKNAPVAHLRGRVRLADGAALPAYAPFDLSRAPLLDSQGSPPPRGCAEANERARHPVALGADRGLSSVVVAASDFRRFKPRDPLRQRVQIRDCQLSPALVAAQAGDLLELENLDAFGFEPVLGPTFEARVLSPREPMRVRLQPGSVESLLCSPRAPCGRSDLVVFFHPVYAVTDAQGEFRIDDFPAAEQVRISAWHPLFEEAETYVWLQPGEHAVVDLVLHPKARFVAPSDLSASVHAQP